MLGCTVTACPAKVAAANPLTYIGDRRTPPFLILHGEQDSIVPHHQSRLLYDKLVASGDDAHLISFPKAGHGTAFAMLSDDAIRAGAYEQTTRGGRSTPPSPVTPTWQTVISFLEQSMAKKSR
ncbi:MULTISPECIES: prolyl oligopeptidase family serine peptidase [unclassified Streptomyces]|uniref:prolyl oligopeptidase family serine peptidase n=1 Tax=unclassified Streptomyces TaxID=2593676 RepID=UPI0037F4F978